MGTPENKLAKRGVFFSAEKVRCKAPRLPRNSPQIHHDFTIKKHGRKPKTPAKTWFCHAKFFWQKSNLRASSSQLFTVTVDKKLGKSNVDPKVVLPCPAPRT
ncbi:hypothetical protein [Tunturiibacter lichenicola]|uniref:hypothetical protein n=1 Tax=Tunturiibacter lichenicola TaxID=2051959 RepID=UPI0021B1CC11|nr:hypothetical protein [Edaphobacter lichenicola]